MDILINALSGAPHYIIATLVLLTIVVFFHELGHFWVARRCGVHVDVFSVGFGKELLGFTDRKGTRWKISAIPLGGYVKMKGQSDTEGLEAQDPTTLTPEERAGSFLYKPLWQKAAIVFAGPAANYVLAVIVFAILFATLGRLYTPPVVGLVEPGSAAEAAGIRTGDRVMSVSGYEINDYNRILYALQLDLSDTVPVVVKRGDQTITLQIKPRTVSTSDEPESGDNIRYLGFAPYLQPIIGEVTGDGAAAAAGLQSGDRIVSVGGHPIEDFGQVPDIVTKSEGKPLEIVVDRAGQRITVTATPTLEDAGNEKRYMLGIAYRDNREPVRLAPLTAAWVATEDTVRATGLILTTVGQMIVGQRSSKELGGVLRIGKIAGDTAQASLPEFLTLVALISINLGLVNLFPIPLLDGGHLAFYGIEAIRGRPLSPRVQDIALRVGLAAVASLMLFAVWNDLKYLQVIAFLKNLVS